MKTFRKINTFALQERDCEATVGASVAVPNEALSIREILDRFTRGGQFPDHLMRHESFDPGADLDSEDLEKLKSSDLVDQVAWSEAETDSMLAKDAKVKDMKRKRSEKQKQEAEELAELKAELKARKAARVDNVVKDERAKSE